MKKSIFMLGLLMIFKSFGQTIEINSIPKKDTIKDVVVSANTIGFLADYMKKRNALFIAIYIDSLNSYMEGALPIFLSDYNFDYTNDSLWENSHGGQSFRQAIFEKVTNQKCLKAILSTHSKAYKKTSDKRIQVYGPHKIPFQDDSNWSLAKRQLAIFKKTRQ